MSKRKADGSLCEEQVVKFTSGRAIVEEYSLEWKIENFLVIKSFEDLLAEQQFSFEVGESSGYPTKWSLKLEKKSAKNTIGIFLELESAPTNFRTIANCSFQKMKPDGTSDEPNSFDRILLPPNSSWGFCEFLLQGDEALQELIWEDGSIVIKVDMKYFLFEQGGGMPKGKGLQKDVAVFEKRELGKIRNSMTRMIELDSQPEAGKIIEVVSKDGVAFNANTASLSARSPVFQAMFDGGKWKEGQGSLEGGKSSLVLEDLSGKTVRVLLHFVTGGVLLKGEWNAEDVILELTWAAQKYQLEGLTKFLDKVLPGMAYGTEILAKLAVLTKRLGMKNAEKSFFSKLKETSTDIDQLLLDKEGSLLGSD